HRRSPIIAQANRRLLMSDDLRLVASGDRHENTPRVWRVLVPLILVHDQFGEVALVVQAPESENDAVLGCQEEMDATDAQVPQADRRFEKLLTQRSLLVF